MVMQKDTADSHSVCPGEAVEYIIPSFLKKCFMYMNIDVNILSHCTN